MCGGTTAVVNLGQARFTDALAASPLVVGLAAALPFHGLRWLDWLWRRRALAVGAGVAVLLAAELWQLHRFGFLT